MIVITRGVDMGKIITKILEKIGIYVCGSCGKLIREPYYLGTYMCESCYDYHDYWNSCNFSGVNDG